MRAEKDKKTGKWLIQYRYTDWQGKRRKSTKRGFANKREAEEWLRNFLITQNADFDMKFEEFWKMYCADMETRLRDHTMITKKYIVELKILPYFGKKRILSLNAFFIAEPEKLPRTDRHPRNERLITFPERIEFRLKAVKNPEFLIIFHQTPEKRRYAR